jgi:hypothetical protein
LHDVVVPATQVPVPLHIDAVCVAPPLQPAARQTVVAAHLRHAPPPSQKPSSPHVDAADAEHSPRGLVPAAALMHVPTEPTSPQVWQVPPQALLQQTPSTQKPLAQSPAVLHATPFCSCGTHRPAAQWLPAVQSLFEPQLVAHAAVAHMNAPQELVPGVWQTPRPLQVLAGWYVEPVHEEPMHVVPITCRRQAPAPSHMPSRPQVDASSAAHSLSGSVPPTTGRHRPSAWAVFAAAQAAQASPQVDSQQTPSTQLPLAHSTAEAHATPCAFTGTHDVLAQ